MMTRYLMLLAVASICGCGPDTPTGVNRADIQGLWTGTFATVTLMGRQLTGEFDWQFNQNTFEIQFVDPSEGESQQIAGDWNFSEGKLILILATSFPIGADVGATDSLFISILNDELSMQPLAGSAILLLRTQGFLSSIPSVLKFKLIAVRRRSVLVKGRFI